ncbi:MAG: tRNA (N6-threonylcarbamoyladenosine(37)-N6)-methyltransferase TrmO [Clostridia bacterium]|nr:tRNA (N6-threonylcarbamoyladenosine(37)-N6)-methyltransferase TrmO [Clostridia bacterium]
MKIIARIYNDYVSKFGVPRQSGLVENENSIIVFEPEYRYPEALRGLEEYNYLWLIWEFSEFKGKEWSPTVRPPRLGGNRRMGVFATRSPHRPNPLGLSAVRLEGIKEINGQGTVIVVSGADLMNGTPIYDIKPYLHYADCKQDSNNGFVSAESPLLEVVIDEKMSAEIPGEKLVVLKKVLAQDPRPRYIDDADREFGLSFSGFNIKFKVNENILTVTEIEKIRADSE